MTQAPERIWRDKPQTKRGYVDGLPSWPTQSESYEGTEYIRADLVPQWQPIETLGPDNCAEFLAYWPDQWDNGSWNIERTWFVDGWFHTPNDKQEAKTPWAPTHWMPLPQAPEVK